MPYYILWQHPVPVDPSVLVAPIGVVNLKVIIPEIASVAMLLRNDRNPCSVFAREAVQLAAPLIEAILGLGSTYPRISPLPAPIGGLVKSINWSIIFLPGTQQGVA
jgi:hypothetical protein